MELSVIENDHSEVRKYLENFVPDNYYRVLGDAYLYQVRAVLLHAVRNPGEYNARYDALINSLTAQFEDSRVSIGSQISAWADKQGVHAQRLTYLEAENSTVQSSITELEKAVIDVNKVYLEKTNKLEAQIKDFEVGGVNLIHNSTFDKGYEAIGDVSVSTSDYVLGTMYKCENIGDTESVFGIGSTEEFYKIKLMEGKKYTLSFYGYGDVDSINQIKLIKGDLVHVLDPIPMGNDITDRRVITFNAPFSGDDIGFSIATSGFVNGSWFTVVAIQLELGGRATDWAPSPFDDADYIARVAASLEEFRSITLGMQEATVQALDTLRANIGKNAGEIQNEREVNLTRNQTTVRQLDELTALSNDNLSKITNLDTATSTRFEATAEKLTELEASVGASNSSIERLDNVASTNTSAIASTSSSLTAKIEGLEIGGRNLIRNSTFKLGHMPWGGVDITRTDTVLGSEIEAVSTATGQFGIQNDSLFHTISLVEGKEYTLSMYANGNIDSLNSIWLQSEGNEPQLLPSIPLTETLADKQSVTFTSSMTADNVSLIVAAAGYPVGSWFKFIALQLEKGNKATDWTEAPEDILNYITEANASIDEFKEAQVDFNEATTTSLTTMQSNIGNNSSAITNNYKTLSDKNTALVSRLDTYIAAYDANKVKVTSDIKAVSDAHTATAGKLDTLETEYEDNKTLVTNSINSINTKNVALTTSVNNISTQVAGNTTAISNETTARVDGFKAVNESLSTLTTNFEDNKASVSKELETLATKDTAIVKDINSLNTKTDSANTEIATIKTVVADNKTSIAKVRTDLQSEYDEMAIGGHNLLPNTVFDDTTVTKYGSGNYLLFDDNTETGGIRCGSTSTERSPFGFIFIGDTSKRVKLRANQEYTLSFYGQSTLYSLSYCYIMREGKDNIRLPNIPISAGYNTQRSMTFTLDENIENGYLLIGAQGSSGDWFALNSLVLQRGNKASAWNKSPLDYDNELAISNARITSEATTRAAKDLALTSRIDAFTSGFGDKSLSTIIDEVKTYADTDKASAQKFAALTAGYENTSLASIVTDLKTYSDKDKASASSLSNLTAGFNNLEIGGENLLPNSDFSKGYTPWNSSSQISQTEHYGLGLYTSVKNATEGGTFGVYQANDYRTAKIYKGETYTLSWIGQGTFDGLNYMHLLSSKNGSHRLPVVPLKVGRSNKYEVTFKAPYTTDDLNILVGAVDKPKDAWFSVSNLMLQKGNKATEWSRSPLDAEEEIAKADARITAEAKVAAAANKSTAEELKTVKSNVGANTSTIQTVSNAVSTNKDAIATTKSTLEAKINNQVIGGDNLIPDSLFEKGVYTYGNPTIYQGHQDGYETPYIRATCRAAGDAFGVIPHSSMRNLRLLAGEEYTLSFFGQATFNWLNYIYIMSPSKGNQRIPSIRMGSGMRNKKSVTFTSDNVINDGYILLAANNLSSGDWFAFGGLQLQRGNVATTWKPSGIELSSSLEETKEVVAGVSAQWSMQLNVNGKISGIYQSSTSTVSDLEIVTDNFKLSTGTSTGISPFRSEGTKVYINDAFIKDGDITNAKIANGAITTAKIGLLQVDFANIKNGAIDTIKIANGAIETAKIGNAQVDTLQIKGEAVIVPRVQFTASVFKFYTIDTEEVINSITIDAAGGGVSISFGFEKLEARIWSRGQNPNVILRIKRGTEVLRTLRYEEHIDRSLERYTDRYNDTQIRTISQASGYVKADNITLPTILDTPPAGSHTYTVTLESRGLNAGLSSANQAPYPVEIAARSLHIMGAKR